VPVANVGKLRKSGALEPGWNGGWQWTRDGERVAWINLRAEVGEIVLTYRFRYRGSEDWQDVTEPVSIAWRPCRYGGERPFFRCPRVGCGRLVLKLYGEDRYFLCRHCYRLPYASQREDACDRALRRADRIRMRLGGAPGMAWPVPDRPKGMWRLTYWRLVQPIHRSVDLAAQKMEMMLGRLNAIERESPRFGRRR
jgi:hypothetical protein